MAIQPPDIELLILAELVIVNHTNSPNVFSFILYKPSERTVKELYDCKPGQVIKGYQLSDFQVPLDDKHPDIERQRAYNSKECHFVNIQREHLRPNVYSLVFYSKEAGKNIDWSKFSNDDGEVKYVDEKGNRIPKPRNWREVGGVRTYLD
jgi:hypothetical protein